MPAPARAFFKSFGLGINDNTPANQIKDGHVVDALNFEFDKQSNFRSRQGAVKLDLNHNILLRTEELENAAWSASGTLTRTANTVKDPLGALTADIINDTDGAAAAFIHQASATASNNEIWAFSIYVKAVGSAPSNYPAIGIQFEGGSSAIYRICFDNFNGTYTLVGGSPTVTIETINPNGGTDPTNGTKYFRVTLVGANNASGNTTIRATIHPAFNANGSGTVNVATTGPTTFWGTQLERATKASAYYKNVATASLVTANYLTSRVTSIVQFTKEDGTSGIFITSGSKIWRFDASNNFFVDASGGLTLPSDTYWQWVVYRDTLIGVNRANTASGATNPVKITSTTGSAVALGGTPPKGRFIEFFNDRIWIVNEDDPSSIKCSALGLVENYTNVGISGAQSFEIGAEITGIRAHKDRLFIFTKSSTHYIQPGSPNTDISQYELKIFNPKVGCVSAYSIQAVLDDLIFLSSYGLTSLAAVQEFGDFEAAILSQNLADLNNFQLGGDNSGSAVYSAKSQYFISAPLGVNTNHTKTFVFDFTAMQSREVGFTEMDGLLLAPCFAEVILNGKRRLLAGGYSDATNQSNTFVYKLDEPNIFNDDGAVYTQRIITKAHDLEAFVTNKIFHRTLFDISLLTPAVNFNWSYRINEKDELKKTWPISFTSEVVSGAIYDVDTFDSGTFAVLATPFKTVQRRIVGPPGRIGQSIQFILEILSKDIGIVFKGYGLDAEVITSRRLTGG